MIYATSDLHGCPLENMEALLKSASFSDSDVLYVLGDVIDRGRHGIELLKWIRRAPNIKLLRGNHEQMMLDCAFLFDEITEKSVDKLRSTQLDSYYIWVSNGGDVTVNELRAVRHREILYLLEYLSKTPLYECVTVGDRDFVLTHSGLGNFDRDRALSQYTADELLWTRPRLDTEYYENKTVVFGHTPTVLYGPSYRGRILKTATWVNIDVGAAAFEKPALLRLDDMAEFYID